jgi:hypothetical protein
MLETITALFIAVLTVISIAVIACGPSVIWFWWVNRHDLPARFSLRSLMIALTLVSILLGLVAVFMSAR